MVVRDITNAIWRIAEILRGDYKQSEYRRIILPFTLLRRIDCMLAATKDHVLAEHPDYPLTFFLLYVVLLKKLAKACSTNTLKIIVI